MVTQFVYDKKDIIAEIGVGENTINYLRGLRIDELFIRQAETVEYFRTDALGSTLALTNQSGVVTTSYQYESFGKTNANGPSQNSFQFTGRENDGTGLYHYRARNYSPGFQRFLSEDPLECQRTKGRNLYAYVENNPLRFTDPSGLVSIPLIITDPGRCMQIFPECKAEIPDPADDKLTCELVVCSSFSTGLAELTNCNYRCPGGFDLNKFFRLGPDGIPESSPGVPPRSPFE